MAKKFIRFLPALIWMSFIFFLSSQQTTGIQGTYQERFIILKTFHLIEYSILFALLFFAFRTSVPSAGLAFFYSVTDEFHQLFVPGRTGRPRDTLIDLIGITIGYVTLKLLLKHPYVKKIFSQT